MTKPAEGKEQQQGDSTVLPDAQDASAASNEPAAASSEICIAGHGSRKCGCRLCGRASLFLKLLDQVDEKHHVLLHAIYDDLEAAEFDRNHLQSIVDGSWPDADEVIARHRQLARAPSAQTSVNDAATEQKPNDP